MLKSARRKKEKDPEGRMPLAEHLRELRNRLVKALLGILAVTIVAAFFYNDIIELFTRPVLNSVGCRQSFAELAQKDEGTTCAQITINGLITPFTLALKVSLMAGLVLASPVWLYQLWAFLAPGLHRQEKKYALAFVGAGFPLFLGGGWFAYLVLPTTAKVLIEFTPGGVDNLLPLDDLLDLVTRMVIVFGLSFELPLLLVMLNLGGVLSGRRMLGWWRGMVLGITLFSAIATPSTDPLTMLALAMPIWVLYFAAVALSLLNDSRRRAREDAELSPDEASELDLPYGEIAPSEPAGASGRPALPPQQTREDRGDRGDHGERNTRVNGFDDAT
ncbi:twin-arginine translocase subunit TatC [Streptomyces zingiberis]|uniref:Sec-independent protein translocase protein TatC n=1 Tax=Streptomyces zingiberis TaxID=2053010 RepID=A0ABX1BWF4_9ACTN|nr:twin-arginine translocase subunit TatC [Streptomyces zingiberis]NJQ01418.1 twin-arginine translocase subunit TatC [Streptomyces zingiberis]